MPLSADEMIAALDGFEADSGYDDNQFRLYPVTDGFEGLPDRERVVPAMFALMERFPDAYMGTPGPLVHSIESLGAERYEPLLTDSVRRQPVELNVWMINRMLNANLQPEHRRLLLDLLRSVPEHPNVTPRIAQLARSFLEYQAKREVS
jgi:hypothetical protein